MGKQIDAALAAIDRLVFEGKRPIVVALTGGWGEGKTYFWQRTVVPKHKNKKPGYVSVFGAESMTAIRERVVLACLPQIDEEKAGRIPDAIKNLKGPLLKVVNRLSDYWGEKFGLSASIGIELMQSQALKAGSVICIDDIERRSQDVPIESLLGYVAELRDKWQMNVVLIYNREPLEANEELFKRYQEKVIDRSIPFAMESDAVGELVFADSRLPALDVESVAKECIRTLGLRNIRVVAKARDYFEEVTRVLGPDADPAYLRAVLVSTVLFTAVRYSHPAPAGLTFKKLKSYSVFASMAKKKTDTEGGDDTNSSEQAQDLLERYGYRDTDDLDRVLIDLVESDVLDEVRLKALYASYQQATNKKSLGDALSRVIDLRYHGTLRSNCDQLSTELIAALEPYLPFVGLGQLDFALHILMTCGKDADASRLFETFRKGPGKTLGPKDDHGIGYRDFSYAPLREFSIEVFESDANDKRTLEEVAQSAFSESFIHSADSERISKFSVDELVQYFLTHDQLHLTGKLRMLVRDANMETRAKAQAAAEKLADLSQINRMRLEGMGIVKPRNEPAGGSAQR